MSDLKICLEKKIIKTTDGNILLGSRKLKKIKAESKESLPMQCYFGSCFAIKNDTIVEFYSYCDIGGKFHGTANFLAIDYADLDRLNNPKQFDLKNIERTQSSESYINFIFAFVQMGFSIYIVEY